MFFPYFVYGAKPSAGEQLAGGKRKMANKLFRNGHNAVHPEKG